jgi:hypothetical protein
MGDPRSVPQNVELDTADGSGLSTYRSLSVAGGAVVKSSPGRVYGWYFANRTIYWRYLKIYDKATTPAVGTDVPKLTLPLPPESAGHVPLPQGIQFTSGIAIAATQGLPDSDATLANGGDVVLDLFYA